MPFEYQLQQLCERPVTSTTRLSEIDRWRLNTATSIVENNNYRLVEYVDGDLVTNPIYICPEEAQQETGFTVLRLLHNYLASLYSYNETVRVLFNEYAPERTTLSSGAFTPASGGTDASHYGRKLSFLRGLRTDFQHGGFSCLRFTRAGTLHGFGAYHLEFDRQSTAKLSHHIDDPRELKRRVATNRTYLERLDADPLMLDWPPESAERLRWRIEELIAVCNRFAPEDPVQRLRQLRERARDTEEYERLRNAARAREELTPEERERLASGAIEDDLENARRERERLEEALAEYPER